MEKSTEGHTGEFSISPLPTGGVQIDQQRMGELAPLWERTALSLRIMDEVALGETEPATLFVWRMDRI
ncbi:MAG: hypothetical protein M0Z94_18870 [Dehalococcoidales bacterium]|nr:hypothetical protein [Dehalococcoidales bacterium]